MSEIQRYYRAKVYKDGECFLFSFRADNKEEAILHARQCCANEGYTYSGCKFLGTVEPDDAGVFMPRGW